jgi:hypothetical protein
MYTDEKLVFYGLFLKSLFENSKKRKRFHHSSENGYPEEKL